MQKNICAREQIIADWKGKIPRGDGTSPPTRALERAGRLPWAEIARWDSSDGGVIIMGDEYERCMKGLEGFSHFWMFYLENKNEVKARVVELQKAEEGRIYVNVAKQS